MFGLVQYIMEYILLVHLNEAGSGSHLRIISLTGMPKPFSAAVLGRRILHSNMRQASGAERERLKGMPWQVRSGVRAAPNCTSVLHALSLPQTQEFTPARLSPALLNLPLGRTTLAESDP